jgi:hypothetical protein
LIASRHDGWTEREESVSVLRRLIYTLASGARPFRMMGKGLPARGSGPRLTDRKHYK